MQANMPNILEKISFVLKLYGTSITKNMLPGQQASEGVYNKIRIKNEVLSPSVQISSTLSNFRESNNITIKLRIRLKMHKDNFL